MSRCCSLPLSDADRGATSPRRLNAFTIFLSSARSSAGRLMVVPVTPPSRRSIAPTESGASASAAAVTSSDPNMNASNTINTVTLHLDLDDPADPEKPNRLHDDRDHQRHLAHLVVEEQLHVPRVEERQRDGQGRRQGEQDESGEPA